MALLDLNWFANASLPRKGQVANNGGKEGV